MSEKFNLVPYFENPANLAGALNATVYAAQWGCHYAQALSIRRVMILDFIHAIKERATSFYMADEASNEFEAHIITETGTLILIVDKGHSNYTCSLFSNMGMDHIYEFIQEFDQVFASRSVNDICISYLYHSQSKGFSKNKLYIEKEHLQPIYPELYPDIDIQKLLNSYSHARESILMLYGAPGVGKTTFIKFLLAVGGCISMAYVKDPKVMNMGEMWNNLTSEDYDFVIFDDLDTGLAPRSKADENNTFMTQLLSFSDGIFHSNKTKIIITTNQKVQEIDGALVRPGRCFDFIHLQPLDRERALFAWTKILKLSEERFNEVFGDQQEITQASLMSEGSLRHSSVNRDYIRNSNRDYTLDQKLAQLNIKVTNSSDGGQSFGFTQ